MFVGRVHILDDSVHVVTETPSDEGQPLLACLSVAVGSETQMRVELFRCRELLICHPRLVDLLQELDAPDDLVDRLWRDLSYVESAEGSPH